MAIRTQESINGFIASEPRVSYNDEGLARFYARIGINHYEPLDGGGFRKLEPTFHDLVQFGKGAERSADRFVKGDDFVAQGYVREYTRTVDGQERAEEQFVAKRLAHDPNVTTYTVDRRPAADRAAAERQAAQQAGPAQEAAQHAPVQPTPVQQAPVQQAAPVQQVHQGAGFAHPNAQAHAAAHEPQQLGW